MSGGAGTTRAIMGKGRDSFAFEVDTSNRLILARNWRGILVTATTPVPDTTGFHHVAATKNGATVKLYLNGADVTGTVTNQTMTDNYAKPLQVAADGDNGTRFTGVIDEAAFYTTALSAATITTHYQRR